MNIYSLSQQDPLESQDEQSQVSWSRIHKSSSAAIYNKSKKINKRVPEEIQKKWFSLRKISSCKQDLQEKKEVDLRQQSAYDFDYLQLDQDLLMNTNPILAVDKKSGRTYLVKVASELTDIIEKLFQLNQNCIIGPENLFVYHVQSHKIDDLAKEIKIVNISFSLLLFEHCLTSIKCKCHDLMNKQIKTIFLDLIYGLISARSVNLVLTQVTLDSILFSESKEGYKLQDFTTATLGNNFSNLKDLGKCLAEIIQRRVANKVKIEKQLINNEIIWLKSHQDEVFSDIALEMIQSEKDLEEILELLEGVDV